MEFLVHLKLQHLPFDWRTRSEKYDVKNDQISCRWCNETSSELKSGRCLQAVFTVTNLYVDNRQETDCTVLERADIFIQASCGLSALFTTKVGIVQLYTATEHGKRRVRVPKRGFTLLETRSTACAS
jgi:hypothetical protein